jgi:hypothetical protein
VPEPVVDQLEPIEIDEQHGKAPAVSRIALQGVGEAIREQRPVRQPCEDVVERLMAQARLGGPQQLVVSGVRGRHGGLLAEMREQVALLPGELAPAGDGDDGDRPRTAANRAGERVHAVRLDPDGRLRGRKGALGCPLQRSPVKLGRAGDRRLPAGMADHRAAARLALERLGGRRGDDPQQRLQIQARCERVADALHGIVKAPALVLEGAQPVVRGGDLSKSPRGAPLVPVIGGGRGNP